MGESMNLCVSVFVALCDFYLRSIAMADKIKSLGFWRNAHGTNVRKHVDHVGRDGGAWVVRCRDECGIFFLFNGAATEMKFRVPLPVPVNEHTYAGCVSICVQYRRQQSSEHTAPFVSFSNFILKYRIHLDTSIWRPRTEKNIIIFSQLLCVVVVIVLCVCVPPSNFQLSNVSPPKITKKKHTHSNWRYRRSLREVDRMHVWLIVDLNLFFLCCGNRLKSLTHH